MTTTSTAAYWEPLWAGGRRYRQLDGPENRLMDEYLGPGRGRPALDLGCGDGCFGRERVPRRSCRFTRRLGPDFVSRYDEPSCSSSGVLL
jgi:hypothetical protein